MGPYTLWDTLESGSRNEDPVRFDFTLLISLLNSPGAIKISLGIALWLVLQKSADLYIWRGGVDTELELVDCNAEGHTWSRILTSGSGIQTWFGLFLRLFDRSKKI